MILGTLINCKATCCLCKWEHTAKTPELADKLFRNHMNGMHARWLISFDEKVRKDKTTLRTYYGPRYKDETT